METQRTREGKGGGLSLIIKIQTMFHFKRESGKTLTVTLLKITLRNYKAIKERRRRNSFYLHVIIVCTKKREQNLIDFFLWRIANATQPKLCSHHNGPIHTLKQWDCVWCKMSNCKYWLLFNLNIVFNSDRRTDYFYIFFLAQQISILLEGTDCTSVNWCLYRSSCA